MTWSDADRWWRVKPPRHLLNAVEFQRAPLCAEGVWSWEPAQAAAAQMYWEMVTTGCYKSMTSQIADGKSNVSAFLIESLPSDCPAAYSQVESWLGLHPSEL